jgi:hypothetical protein
MMTAYEYDNSNMMRKGFVSIECIEKIETDKDVNDKDIIVYVDYYMELHGNGLTDQYDIDLVKRLIKHKINKTSWNEDAKDTAKILITFL